MACKNGQCDTEHEETGGITEHFPQHATMYDPGVGHPGTDESRQKKNNHLYHAPEGGGGDHHAVSHRQAIEQIRTLLVNPVGYLPANRFSFLPKQTSGFLANGNFTRST